MSDSEPEVQGAVEEVTIPGCEGGTTLAQGGCSTPGSAQGWDGLEQPGQWRCPCPWCHQLGFKAPSNPNQSGFVKNADLEVWEMGWTGTAVPSAVAKLHREI